MTKEQKKDFLQYLENLKIIHADDDYFREGLDIAISALSENKTQMIDKSNFDIEQYKADLQSAYDCGYNKALSENKGEWIPVSKRLPEAYQKILVTYEEIHWANEPITYGVKLISFGELWIL